ncbi:MAG: nucleotidyltransferase family protein [Gammaproteobacteria bacterium]|nr:nucleotidyltransferase family protein [Gammaproteobacteria bacterium]
MHPGPEFTALVLAGSRGAGDPVARAGGCSHKALVTVAGVPMLARVLDALAASSSIRRIVICVEADAAVLADPHIAMRVAEADCSHVDAAGSPARSVLAAMAAIDDALPLLVVTGDHPLLSSAMIDHFCRAARAADVAVGLARAELVLAAYPRTVRTQLRFADGARCGCNLFALNTAAARAAPRLWQRVEAARKRPWRVIGAFGAATLLRYACGTLSTDAAMAAASARLGVTVRAVDMPFADAAVDVDSAADLALVRQRLETREHP